MGNFQADIIFSSELKHSQDLLSQRWLSRDLNSCKQTIYFSSRGLIRFSIELNSVISPTKEQSTVIKYLC